LCSHVSLHPFLEVSLEEINGGAYATGQKVLRACVITIYKVLIGREALLAHAAAGVEAEGFFYNGVLGAVVSFRLLCHAIVLRVLTK